MNEAHLCNNRELNENIPDYQSIPNNWKILLKYSRRLYFSKLFQRSLLSWVFMQLKSAVTICFMLNWQNGCFPKSSSKTFSKHFRLDRLFLFWFTKNIIFSYLDFLWFFCIPQKLNLWLLHVDRLFHCIALILVSDNVALYHSGPFWFHVPQFYELRFNSTNFSKIIFR